MTAISILNESHSPVELRSCKMHMRFTLGDKVCLENHITYLKTAEPMPTLRPPDLVTVDEIGEVLAIQPSGTLAVEFNCGVFILESKMLRYAYETTLQTME
uniref:Uncharacterized protein n=1 Tax=Paulinella chromatophora TaxID=39717 RepID=B1X434_PAUCH|nr:hypothetical protein PCC_0254 [Paulinella chromatophora]ACB42703.1 hypothetical protein PCC_0254 [Paulinella chromatophora]